MAIMIEFDDYDPNSLKIKFNLAMNLSDLETGQLRLGRQIRCGFECLQLGS